MNIVFSNYSEVSIPKEMFGDKELADLKSNLYSARNHFVDLIKQDAKSRKISQRDFDSMCRVNLALSNFDSESPVIHIRDLSSDNLLDLRHFAFRIIGETLGNQGGEYIMEDYTIDILRNFYILVKMIDEEGRKQ